MDVFGSSQSSETKKKIFQTSNSRLNLNTETWATQHWIFKNSKSNQDNKSQKTNKWLEHNYHQLSIDYGDVEYKEVGKILNSLKFTCIYIKGEQEKQILMEYIPHVVLINIEDIGCPRLDHIYDDENLPCRIFHMEFNPKQCTFYKILNGVMNVLILQRCMFFLFFCFVSVYSITSRNNASISNFEGGFRWKSEYPWCIIEKKIEKNKKKMTEKREFLCKTSFRPNRFFYMVVIQKLIIVPYEFSNFYEICRKHENLQILENFTSYLDCHSPYMI
ncbi:hypothetical protein AGLY_017584 [Aphis glycines]|uniref:Uncharacterized protein n=1 Tax=Aphis glycines TaxID=307491 RepID=A0A6G0SUS6_APHGL|nr:hypothetical protein AGLY_017584 [Aphis glycines]